MTSKAEDGDEIVLPRDPANRRSFINKSAYAKLQRSSVVPTDQRHSVGNLKAKFERTVAAPPDKPNSSNIEETRADVHNPFIGEIETETKFTPADFGYPKAARLSAPLLKNKDENSNLVVADRDATGVAKPQDDPGSESEEERGVLIRKCESVETVDKIELELSNFTMDGGNKKERKRSFRKFVSGVFSSSGKDKKRQERHKPVVMTMDNTDNARTESGQRPPIPYPNPHHAYNLQVLDNNKDQMAAKKLEERFAEHHISHFQELQKNFAQPQPAYVPMDQPPKRSITDFISAPVNKYIDTSSSASTESERPVAVARDTPPRAQETYQNFRPIVKPRATIPINTERPLPNPYENGRSSPRTIERNLNTQSSKDYPDKSTLPPRLDDTYGTVFDSLEYVAARNGDLKPLNSPKSPSLEVTKLKLPPNREILELQPRVRSPLPSSRVSTDRIIATELLKSSRSPTPTRKTTTTDTTVKKPPISPKPRPPRLTINAMVHEDPPVLRVHRDHPPPVLRRSETPSLRPVTPVDLRMSAALKLSPQKDDIRRSVEEYYWKELKKMKEDEDEKLFVMQMSNGYIDDSYARVRRSRSLSPSQRGRRSLSLPRDLGDTYGRMPQPHQSIPEERPLVIANRSPARRLVYDNQASFVRGNPERRSVDSLQRPIFRRGSLTRQEIYENNYAKRVSFENSQRQQSNWPTRNGYAQSPPQRRLDSNKRDSALEDDVFLPNSPKEPVYGQEPLYGRQPVYVQRQEPVYGQRVAANGQRDAQSLVYVQKPVSGQELVYVQRAAKDQRDTQSLVYVQNGQEPLYGQRPPQEPLYGQRPPPEPLYVQRYPDRMRQYPQDPRRLVAYQPQRVQDVGYYQNVTLQRMPQHSSRQSLAEPIYYPKQITVSNKYCDIYGKIHDSPQKGVVMGQLQTRPPQHHLTRGSRLTSSASDIERRYPQARDTDPRYRADFYDNRPLPPVPGKGNRLLQVSDTESGSEASEIQRIMKQKTKKRGLFGK